jgi:hypothetical protein
MTSGQTAARSLYLWTPCVRICMCACKDSVVPVPAHTRTNLLQECGAGPRIRKQCPHGKRADYCKVSISLDSLCAHLHVRVQGLCGSCASSHANKPAAGVWRRAKDPKAVSAWQGATPLQGLYIAGLLVCASACARARTLWFLCQLTREQTCCRNVAQGHGSESSVRMARSHTAARSLYLWTPCVRICMCACKDSVVPVPAHTRTNLLQECGAGPRIRKKCPHGKRADCCKVSISLDSLCAHLHVRVQGLCGSCASSHATNLLQECGAGPQIRKKCPHGKEPHRCKVSISLDSLCAHLHVRVQGLCGSCASSHANKPAAGVWQGEVRSSSATDMNDLGFRVYGLGFRV